MANGLYIPSYAELAQHPKMILAALALDVSVPAMIGHLHLLWYWAVKYAPNGNLSRYPHAMIAKGAMWDGDPERFVDALLDCGPTDGCGFLEADEGGALVLHDWGETVGPILDARENNAARQRAHRAKVKAAHNSDVRISEQESNSYVTVTNALRNGQREREIEREIKKESSSPLPPKQAEQAASAADDEVDRSSDKFTLFKRSVASLTKRGKLTIVQERRACDWYDRHAEQIIPELIDFALDAVGKHDSLNDPLTYWYACMESHLGKDAAAIAALRSNGNGKANGVRNDRPGNSGKPNGSQGSSIGPSRAGVLAPSFESVAENLRRFEDAHRERLARSAGA